MIWPEHALRPGERLAWRPAETARREHALPGLGGPLLVAAMIAGTVYLLSEAGPEGALGLAFAVATVLLALIVAGFLAWRAEPSVAVTSERVLWRAGLLPRRDRAVERAAIAGVTVYEGQAKIVFRLRDGSIARVRNVAQWEELLAAAGLGAEVWRNHALETLDRGWFPFVGGVFLTIALIGFGEAIRIGFGALFGVDLRTVQVGLRLLFGVGVIAPLIVVAIPLLIRVATLFLPADICRAGYCAMIDARWNGREPLGRPPGLLVMLYWRLAFGVSARCRVEPEILEPGAVADGSPAT